MRITLFLYGRGRQTNGHLVIIKEAGNTVLTFVFGKFEYFFFIDEDAKGLYKDRDALFLILSVYPYGDPT